MCREQPGAIGQEIKTQFPCDPVKPGIKAMIVLENRARTAGLFVMFTNVLQAA